MKTNRKSEWRERETDKERKTGRDRHRKRQKLGAIEIIEGNFK